MAVNVAIEGEILRLALNEHWLVGTIASTLHLHPDVVTRVLTKHKAKSPIESKKRALLSDNFEPFLKETLEKYPNIHASRLFCMVAERGYLGLSQGHFRRIIKRLRPRKTPEAFLRLTTLPGEQGQADWADFGEHSVPGGSRRLSAFVLTLAHSRAIFLQFFWSSKSQEFLQGFENGFEFFEGVPRTILIDNLKSGVVERVGSIIRYNSSFLGFAKQYRFEPRAVNVRRGNEKGKVERSIRYIRENFFAGRTWTDIADLNTQALSWCTGASLNRIWEQSAGPKTVGNALEEEKKSLVPLPLEPSIRNFHIQVRVGKTPFVRFDTNDYSVPYKYVCKTLDVYASQTTVTIFEEADELARHVRNYGKHQTIEDPKHFLELIKQKSAGQRHAGLTRLVAAVPQAKRFVEDIGMRGENIGGAVSSILRLLDNHGPKRLGEAIDEVLLAQTPRLQSLHFALSKLEHASKTPPTLPAPLPATWNNMIVEQHNPDQYDTVVNRSCQ